MAEQTYTAEEALAAIFDSDFDFSEDSSSDSEHFPEESTLISPTAGPSTADRSTAGPSTASDRTTLAAEVDVLDVTTDEEEENKPQPAVNPGKRTFQWTKRNLRPKKHKFRDTQSGMRPNVEVSSALGYFELFLNLNIINLICEETNKYFSFAANEAKMSDRQKKEWTDVTPNDIYVFITTSFIMTRVKKLSIAEYWSKNTILETPIFSKTLSRNRYQNILRYLHFSSNEDTSVKDILKKIRPIIEHFRTVFKEELHPYEHLCIDESLMLFKGRLGIKQYLPAKRSRFGVKIFVICDVLTNYILDFIVYCGAETDIKKVGLGVSGDTVVTLIEPYLRKGHTLFCDNWYSSPHLFAWLYDQVTNACGTVRHSRKEMPKMAETLKRGETCFRSVTGLMLALKWHDKKDVWMLSTFHKADLAETNKIDYKTGRKILKPTAIIDYNTSMGSVDRSDMVMKTVETIRKSTKWYKKVFFHVLDMALFNSYSLYRTYTKKITYAEFQMQLIQEMLEKFNVERRRSGGGRRIDIPARLTAGNHLPNEWDKYKTCLVCAKNKRRKQTKLYCLECGITLCAYPCFKLYHTLREF